MSAVKVPAGFSLLEGERPVWRGRRSWKSQWFLILLGALTLVFFGLGLLFLLVAYLRVISTEYFVTNRRVYVKYGVVGRTVFELKNEWITSVVVTQGLVQRLLNYGNIIISTPGYYTGTTVMKDVSDPMHVRTVLEETLRKAKEEREIRERLRWLEEEYALGRIPSERYLELKRKYEEELKRFM
jgi:uncharacterized membrane protein YdbT with pleckstrin-like domain